MSLTTDHDDDLLVAVPDYDIIDTLGQSFGRQHARYRIVCKEGGHAWEVQRRWTELRVTIDALKATHVNAFSAPGVPDFEPHAWWRVGPAALQPEFFDPDRGTKQDAACEAIEGAPPIWTDNRLGSLSS